MFAGIFRSFLTILTTIFRMCLAAGRISRWIRRRRRRAEFETVADSSSDVGGIDPATGVAAIDLDDEEKKRMKSVIAELAMSQELLRERIRQMENANPSLKWRSKR